MFETISRPNRKSYQFRHTILNLQICAIYTDRSNGIPEWNTKSRVKPPQIAKMESKISKDGILWGFVEYLRVKIQSPEISQKLLKAREFGRLCRPM